MESARSIAFSILVAICLADKYLAGSERLATHLSKWVIPLLEAALWITVGGWLIVWIAGRTARLARIARRIRIHFPLTGAEVGLHAQVRGSVRPAGSRVQVFVFAANKFWYPQ